MSEPIHDQAAINRHRISEAQTFETDLGEVLEPARPARPCNVPVRPGSHNAAAAYRSGCEDEWIDRMQGRYGEEY
jgi:hypothetical protein